MKKLIKSLFLSLVAAFSLASIVKAESVPSNSNGYCNLIPWACASNSGAGGTGHGGCPKGATNCKKN